MADNLSRDVLYQMFINSAQAEAALNNIIDRLALMERLAGRAVDNIQEEINSLASVDPSNLTGSVSFDAETFDVTEFENAAIAVNDLRGNMERLEGQWNSLAANDDDVLSPQFNERANQAKDIVAAMNKELGIMNANVGRTDTASREAFEGARANAERYQTELRGLVSAEREHVKEMLRRRGVLADAEKQLRSLATEERKREVIQKRLSNILQRDVRTYPQLRAKIRQLTDEYGDFTLTVGRLGARSEESARQLGQMGTRQQILSSASQRASAELREFIANERGLERLNDELQRAANISRQGFVNVDINRASFTNVFERAGLTPYQLNQVAFGLENLGVRGVSAFTQIGAGAGAAAAGAAAVAFGVIQITRLLIRMAEVGVKAFTDLTKAAVEASAEFESTEASFSGVFGSAEIGRGVAIEVRQFSEEVGASVDALVRKALPLVDTLDQARELSELAIGLSVIDPKQGVEGATRAIQAALAGNVQPLQKTFDLDTAPIQEAQKEFGLLEGLLIGLGETLESRGLDLETITDTYIVNVGRMEQTWRSLLSVMGEPVQDEITGLIQEVLAFIKENRDEINAFFGELGEIGAQAVSAVRKILGSSYDDLDDALPAITEIVSGVGDAVSLTAAQLRTTLDILGDLYGPNGMAQKQMVPAWELLGLPTAIEMFEELGRVGLETYATLVASRNTLGSLTVFGSKGQMAFAEGGLEGLLDAYSEERAAILEDITDNYMDAQEAIQESNERSETRISTLRGLTDAEKAQVDAMLDASSAADENAEALEGLTEKAKEAGVEFERAMEKLSRDEEFARQNAEIDRMRSLLDAMLDMQQKVRDAAIKYRRSLDDAQTKNADAIEDAARSLSDKEADIARDRERKMQEIRQDAADKRLEIEQQFYDKLAAIRRKFDFQAEEAIRDNDAVRLREIRRRMEFELNEQRHKRDEDVRENDEAEREKLQDARMASEQAVQDARITNERKLRDLQIALDRENEAIKLRLEREKEDIAQAFKDKRQQIQVDFERELEDIKAQYERRREERKIQYELELMDLKAESAKLTSAQAQADQALVATINAGTRALMEAKKRRLKAFMGGALGGFNPFGGGSTRPTDSGSIPSSRGSIPGSGPTWSPPYATGNAPMGANQIIANIQMVDTTKLSPAEKEQVRTEIQGILQGVLR